jgi:hypothetical protein
MLVLQLLYTLRPELSGSTLGVEEHKTEMLLFFCAAIIF